MGLTGAILDQLDQAGDWGLLATDADLTVTHWNRWLEQRSGLAAVDVVDRPLFEVFPDLVARRVDRYYRQALTGQTVLLSQRFHKYVIPLPPTGDGSEFSHLQQTSRIVPLMEGAAVSGTLTFIEDVTERVAYEAELRSRARQQAAVAAVARSALGGRGVADLARDVVGYVRDILDVDFAEVLQLAPPGQSWSRLAADGWAGSSDPPLEGASAGRTRHVAASGAPGMPVNLSAADILGDPYLRSHGVAGGLVIPLPGSERPFGLVGAYTRYPRQFSPGEVLFAQALADVLGVAAERKRLEGELRLRVRDLAEADRRKDEFLAMLAHELRNPLAPVRNGIQILRAKCGGDPATNRLAEMMERQVGQMARLVDDLLDVSRVTRGRVTLRMDRVNLASAVDQAVEECRPLIDSRRHELNVALPVDPIHVQADPLRLAQVLANLVNNAAKYTEEGGRIWVDVRREGDIAAVSVRDTGVGIAADVLPRVFDLFTQADRTLDRSQGGLGIGLSLVRSLVELHGGTVHASSGGPGRGSEFVVRLPALPPRAQRELTPPATPSLPTAPSSYRILIVDDNVDAADTLAMLLELSGHKVRTAHGGQTALEAAASFRPSVVLLDIGLPGMNGHEVARRLRQSPDSSGVMLVALTGYGQEDDRRKTREAGFDHHLVKPVNLDELNQVLAQLDR